MIVRNTNYGSSVASATKPAPYLRNLCGALYRHKGKMAAVFCGTLALLVAGLIAYPKKYTSDSRIFIRLGKESVSLDPTATMNEVISVYESRENEINSELEILRSRVLLEDVVERLGPEAIVPPSATEGWTQAILGPLGGKSWLGSDASPTEQAVHALERMVQATSPRKSSVLLVTCQARDPKLAQRILQAFLDAYMIRHVHANRTSGSYDFFAAQSKLLGEQLVRAHQELRDAKNHNGMASIEGQRENLEDIANAVEVATLENERELTSLRERIKALEQMLSKMPREELAEQVMVPSDGVEMMRTEWYKVLVREKELSSRFTSNHPQVIAARRQVEAARQTLAEQQPALNQPTRKLSAVYQSAEIDLTTAKASAAAQEAEAAALKKQFATIQSRIRSLNDGEIHISELTRQVELLETSYRTYTANREQSRVGDALEIGHISNVNILQPASFSAAATSPRVKLAFALAVVLAGIAAVLAALLAEHLDQSLRSPEQTEEALGIPVLFSVPHGRRQTLVEN